MLAREVRTAWDILMPGTTDDIPEFAYLPTFEYDELTTVENQAPRDGRYDSGLV